MRKNPVTTLAGSGLPRTFTAIHPSPSAPSENGNPPPKHRGRPPKTGGAVPDKVRKQAQRQREKLEREAAERDAYWAAMKEEAAREHPDNKGRHAGEVRKSNSDIEKIYHAKSRDGEVQEDCYDPTDRGRQVRPEGHAGYSNQEGFSSGRELFESGRSRRSSLPEEIRNPQSRYQNWPTQQTVENSKVVQALHDFASQHVIPYCQLPQNVDRGVQVYCNLKMDAKSQNAQGLPRGTECLFNTAAKSIETEQLDHIRDHHKREFHKYLKEVLPELPAWKDRSRDRQLKGKPFKGECPKKAQHEEWRLKAVERHKVLLSQIAEAQYEDQKKQLLAQIAESSVACPVCKQTIYMPPTPQYAPDGTPAKEEARREELREAAKRPKPDPVAEPRNLPSNVTLKVLSQQALPDLGN